MGKSGPLLGVCAALLTSGGVQAQSELEIYPAAQCAAFWLGFNDYAKSAPFLEKSLGDLKRSDAFRDVAVRLAPGRVTEIDRKIQDQRSPMALLAEAVIYANDEQSRKVFETLAQTCESFGNEQPETRDLK